MLDEASPSPPKPDRGVRHEPANTPPDATQPIYAKGDAVTYWSSSHKDWLPATVIDADAAGCIVIDLKPNTWITPAESAQKVRPRRDATDVCGPWPAAGD